MNEANASENLAEAKDHVAESASELKDVAKSELAAPARTLGKTLLVGLPLLALVFGAIAIGTVVLIRRSAR
jgi:hypothetical protein